MNGDQKREIEQMADYLKQLARAGQLGRQIAVSIGVTTEKWDAVIADCDALADRIAEISERRY